MNLSRRGHWGRPWVYISPAKRNVSTAKPPCFNLWFRVRTTSIQQVRTQRFPSWLWWSDPRGLKRRGVCLAASNMCICVVLRPRREEEVHPQFVGNISHYTSTMRWAKQPIDIDLESMVCAWTMQYMFEILVCNICSKISCLYNVVFELCNSWAMPF
jgi:hypothetical protein